METVKARQLPAIFRDGKQTCDFISVHDIVYLAQLLVEKEAAIGKIFNAGTSKQISFNRLA
ncbi:NDP-glucose dehydratase epimerase [Methanohalophilus mahii]|uniref:NDP-glucose dehydratase epimerase protein n=1 Tax=Methanohalophilus mahii (strain ATCC 35705 / DSM 5219 / SLP) TaxID=547558 RepID=D5E8U3_METMS|nr:NDP-glucose dehydratase epimerase [Methanohalophilus mahii]ADE35602.1 NDP-glucose dehydratase epimerase protein [Methanohalophilus mahii DSM 5219]